MFYDYEDEDFYTENEYQEEIDNLKEGGADIFLDWLCNHPKALSVLPRTHISK